MSKRPRNKKEKGIRVGRAAEKKLGSVGKNWPTQGSLSFSLFPISFSIFIIFLFSNSIQI
jgi:hypothetical protein